MTKGKIRVGIGGWTFEPWRGVFYPKGLRQADELAYAATQVTAIEINGTYYGRQKPASFAAWAKAVPDGFVFSLKASRFCTNRKVLAEAGESIGNFLDQGLVELGDRLGPILWQFMPTKRFDPDDFGAFVKLLPAKVGGLPLRHGLEVRHESFRDPAFVAIARAAGAAIVFADSPDYPSFADLTADFAYARLQNARQDIEAGYAASELDDWAKVATSWAGGHRPQGLDYIAAPDAGATVTSRDAYIFMINGAKVRAPAAAKALIERL